VESTGAEREETPLTRAFLDEYDSDSAGPPLVSVVLPTHNRAALVPRAVRSVLAQTYRHLELVVVDDASGDATSDVLAEFSAADRRVHVVRRELSQMAGNPENPRNTGLHVARGEYVGFLDDDDRYAPEFLERMVAFLATRPQVALAYCDTVFHRQERGREIVTVNRSVAFDLSLLRRVSYVSTTEILVRRSVALAAGGWRYHVKNGPSDQGFVLAVAERAGVAHLREVLGHNYWSNEWPSQKSVDYDLLDPPVRPWSYEPGCEHPSTWRPLDVDLETWSRVIRFEESRP
jgi:glycosyltransferase involved in cell wall biosynthesis